MNVEGSRIDISFQDNLIYRHGLNYDGTFWKQTPVTKTKDYTAIFNHRIYKPITDIWIKIHWSRDYKLESGSVDHFMTYTHHCIDDDHEQCVLIDVIWQAEREAIEPQTPKDLPWLKDSDDVYYYQDQD